MGDRLRVYESGKQTEIHFKDDAETSDHTALMQENYTIHLSRRGLYPTVPCIWSKCRTVT